MAALPMPQKLMQESIVKGDDAFVLLESSYGVSLLWDRLGKQGLRKWEKWPNLTWSADIAFVF